MDSFDYIGHQLMVKAAPSITDAKTYIQNNVDNPIAKVDLNMLANDVHQ